MSSSSERLSLGRRLRFSPLTLTGASITFSTAVMCGNRLKRWNTMPIRDRWRAMSLSLRTCSLPLRSSIADQLTPDPDPATGQGLHLVDQPQEGGLARAAGAEQADHFPGVHRQVDAFEDLVGGRRIWSH